MELLDGSGSPTSISLTGSLWPPLLQEMLSRLTSSSAWRAAPVGVRMLRTTPARLGMLTTPMPAGSAATIDVDKFVTGETVAEHQVRVRHDNNAFRTHNYAVIGEPLPHAMLSRWARGWVGAACRCCRGAGELRHALNPGLFRHRRSTGCLCQPRRSCTVRPPPTPPTPLRLSRRCALYRCVARAPCGRQVPRADEPLG